MKKILMLAGRINSGKDYTADLLVRYSGYIKITFAENLKEYTSKKYDILLDDLYTHSGKMKIHATTNKTYRELLIYTASYLKKDNPDYFVNKLIEKITTTDITSDIVISDFRYPNEYFRLVESLGGEFKIITARVHRLQEVVYEDSSENALEHFKFDQIVDNNQRNSVRLNWFF